MNNPKEFNRLSSAINRLVVERNKLRPRIAELQTQKATTDIEYRNAIGQNSQQKREDLKTIDTDITELKKKISDAEKEYEPQLRDEFDGFQGRMMAYSSLKNESSTWWAAFFISMLFIIIECAPTFMRMMVADGSYEKILEAERHRIRVMSDKRISDLNDSINTEVQISSEKNRHRLEAEVLANKELMEKIAKTQAELLQTAIDKWREEELAKINENPSAYIKTNSEHS